MPEMTVGLWLFNYEQDTKIKQRIQGSKNAFGANL